MTRKTNTRTKYRKYRIVRICTTEKKRAEDDSSALFFSIGRRFQKWLPLKELDLLYKSQILVCDRHTEGHFQMVGVTGFEPASHALKVHCITVLLHSN